MSPQGQVYLENTHIPTSSLCSFNDLTDVTTAAAAAAMGDDNGDLHQSLRF